jgi:hypothetical protein
MNRNSREKPQNAQEKEEEKDSRKDTKAQSQPRMDANNKRTADERRFTQIAPGS